MFLSFNQNFQQFPLENVLINMIQLLCFFFFKFQKKREKKRGFGEITKNLIGIL